VAEPAAEAGEAPAEPAAESAAEPSAEASGEPAEAAAAEEQPVADAAAAAEGDATAEGAEAPAEPAADAPAAEGVAEDAAAGEAAAAEAAPEEDDAEHLEAAATKIAALRRGQKSRRLTKELGAEAAEAAQMDPADMNRTLEDEGEEGLDDLLDEDDDETGMYGDDDGYGDYELLDGVTPIVEEHEDAERTNLAELFKQAQEEKAFCLEKNQGLQRRLAEYLRTVKKSDEHKEVEKSVTDQEQRYFKCLAQVNELKDELSRLNLQYDKTAMEMKKRFEDKEKKAKEIKDAFIEFKREIFKGAENSRTGKPIQLAVIKSFDESESAKDSEVEKMRLANINRRNMLRKLEHTLKQKEKLAEGLHLIDFEQLKIENQTLNEKIEERNEELLKLRKKTTTTVQVLTHLKEKLQFVQAENQVLKHDLADLEIELTNKRDILTQIKHERDSLRAENVSRRQQRGLVSSEDLLLDFEKRRQNIISTKQQVEQIRDTHKALVDQVATYKRQIIAAGGTV